MTNDEKRRLQVAEMRALYWRERLLLEHARIEARDAMRPRKGEPNREHVAVLEREAAKHSAIARDAHAALDRLGSETWPGARSEAPPLEPPISKERFAEVLALAHVSIDATLPPWARPNCEECHGAGLVRVERAIQGRARKFTETCDPCVRAWGEATGRDEATLRRDVAKACRGET